MKNVFEIDNDRETIFNITTGVCTNLGEHEFKLLMILIHNHGEPQAWYTLLSDAWPGKFVTRGSLTKAICSLRSALHDTSPYQIIINVPGKGCYINSSSMILFHR